MRKARYIKVVETGKEVIITSAKKIGTLKEAEHLITARPSQVIKQHPHLESDVEAFLGGLK